MYFWRFIQHVYQTVSIHSTRGFLFFFFFFFEKEGGGVIGLAAF